MACPKRGLVTLAAFVLHSDHKTSLTFCAHIGLWGLSVKTSQELRVLSSVTLNYQVTKIVMDSGSQLSEL